MSNEYASVITENVNEMGFKLVQFADKIANQITRDAANDAAKLFQVEAINNIKDSDRPHRLKVGGKYITVYPGNLKKNIRIKTLRRMVKNQIEVQVYLKKKHAWYGIFYERGTSKMSGRFFMTRAYESKQSEAVEVFDSKIAKSISEGGL